MRISGKVGLSLVAVGIAIAIIAANLLRSSDAYQFKWKINREVPITVRLAPVTRGTIIRTIEGTGRIESAKEFRISPVSAGRIIDLPVRDGEAVKKDQLLAQLDHMSLWPSQSVLRAPGDGTVTGLLLQKGDLVTPGLVIMEISDLHNLVVRARIDERNIMSVQPDQKATLRLQSDARLSLPGTVQRLVPKGIKLGNESAVFEALIQINAVPAPIPLGMTAIAEIQVDEKSAALRVPVQAVLQRRAKDLPRELVRELEESPAQPGVKDIRRAYHQVVFVYADGKARCRLVKTGISDESRVEITSGLNEGDRVVIGPYRVLDQLQDGKAIAEADAHDEADE